jgi:uncharacterized protein YgiM (DUF1202 family)
MRPLSSCVLAILVLGLTAVSSFAASTATTLSTAVLHAGPAARFPRVGVVERNQQATVITCSKSGRWCQIESDGKQGWVMARHLSNAESPSAPAGNVRTAPPAAPAEVKTSPPAVTVETDKAGKGDKLAVPIPGKPVTILIKSADGKVSSTFTVVAGSTVVVTASGRSRCELKAAVNP